MRRRIGPLDNILEQSLAVLRKLCYAIPNVASLDIRRTHIDIICYEVALA
jgi:hypothetical protein